MKTSTIARVGLGLIALLLLLCGLTSCTVTKQPPKSTYDQEDVFQDKDTGQSSDVRDSPFRPANYAHPAPLKGSEARQYRKNLKAETKLAEAQKAAVPKKLGKGAVYAPGATAPVSAAYKSEAPVQVGDSSTLNAVTGGGALATVVGDGNTLEQKPATQQALDWKATFASPIGKVVAGLIVVGVVGLGTYGFIAYRRKRAAEKLLS